MPPTPENIRRLAKRLRAGGLVGVPTETVYGLAADATSDKACAAIFELKGRPRLDPLIVHVAGVKDAAAVCHLHPLAERLMERLWPGPLTLVLPKRPLIPDLVTADRPTVAVRCPGHPVLQELLRETGRPLAAPSANPFGYISPTRAEHVRASFATADLPILDGGPCSIGLESTILDLSEPARPRLLRAGAITAGELEEILGEPIMAGHAEVPATAAGPGLPAPGMLARHYSPQTPSELREPATMASPEPTVARLFYRSPEPSRRRPEGDFWLSGSGDPAEAGRGLYHLLRSLDADARWSRLWIEIPPETPATTALRDRLRRACAR